MEYPKQAKHNEQYMADCYREQSRLTAELDLARAQVMRLESRLDHVLAKLSELRLGIQLDLVQSELTNPGESEV